MGEGEPGPGTRDAADGVAVKRHWGGFIASGCLAFFVDAAVMELGVRWVGLPPLVSRIASVACAMVVAWLAHRTLTFALTTKPTRWEFIRYVAAASTTAAINYAVFAFILVAWPIAGRIPALIIASCVATIFAYVSMRYGVFRRT